MRNNEFTLYQYANRLNGKRYIGVTKEPAWRKTQHAKGDSNARAFNVAVKKYGIEAFDYKVLALFDDAGAAAYHEQAAIITFGTLSPGGYNLTAGAPYTIYGGPFSAETRAKISAATVGRVFSAEHRANLSATHKGHRSPYSAEHREAISAAKKSQSPETKAKISVALKGNRNSIGNKNRQGKVSWNKGLHPSQETRTKMSMARKRRVTSIETRAKMSVSMRVSWAKKRIITKVLL